MKCRSWQCEICQPDRAKQLVAQAKAGRPTTFITLTSNPSTGTNPGSRARDLAKAWPLIAKLACRKYGYKSIPYFCVFEATKRGEPHLHILARVKWIDQKWLSAQMRRLTGAPIVDIRVVRSAGQIAAYVAKYVGKNPHRFETCKRYWCTRSWRLVEPHGEPIPGKWFNGWSIVKTTLNSLRADWEAIGWEVATEQGQLVGRRVPRLAALQREV